MNITKDTAPSAPALENDHLVQTRAAPPSYDEAMSSYPLPGTSYVPSAVPTLNPPYPVQPIPVSGPPALPGNAYYPQITENVARIPPVPPGPQPQTQAVIIQNPVLVGPKAAKIRCPQCLANIKTSIQVENQNGAHIACVILCLLGCCLCSCIPYCMDSCKKVRHSCPNCKTYLGTFVA